LNSVISKAQRIYTNLSRISHPTWGLGEDVVKTLYLRAVEPVVTYACGVWGHIVRLKSVKTKLNSFQRQFAIKIIKSFHTVSLISAQALSGLLPLDLVVKRLYRLERVKRSKTLEDLPDDREYQGRQNWTTLPHHALRATVNYTEVRTDDQASEIMWSSALSIFTDGSKKDDKVGAAYVAFSPEGHVKTRKVKLEDYCSVFQAELVAIKEALSWLKNQQKYNGLQVSLLSDSKSSLEAISNRSSTNPLVFNIHELIKSSQYSLQLYWVKAHSDIYGNDEADKAAKLATTIRSRIIYDKFPLSFAKKTITNEVKTIWNQRYKESSRTGLHRLVSSITKVDKLLLRMKTSFFLTQYLSNHGFHKHYLHRFKITPDDLCPCGEDQVQTTDHLMKTCPAFKPYTQRLHDLCLQADIDPLDIMAVSGDDQVLEAFTEAVHNVFSRLKTFNDSLHM